MRSLGYAILGFFFLATYPDLHAQDTINKVQIDPVLHGSLVLQFNGKTIYLDPYGGAELYQNFPKPDMVLITDIHGDHLHQETLDGIATEQGLLIAPQAVYDKLEGNQFREIMIMNNGEDTVIDDIGIEAIPMYNLPETEDSRHPKGRGNGYILTLGDQRIYISGDTEDTPEMRALRNIDIAFVCMNMPYTMTVEQAADAVNEFKPAVVYPYHYRGRPDMSDTEKFKSLVEANNEVTEVRLRNWYPE
ncbi:MBL fold metallo-hydrolase [Robertkochia sediminum]|uniref:MBL fold metallo-hydrolase n=1 Tax=Robertkochia sediminum TaxID=2785326 RepID=UPI0019332E38|nr:MBL fold metallo-hydrolase [Robertkochia sediminum]MBL7473406.1 MBL fold metallo-hydrolase [Robertkochia sediminum]